MPININVQPKGQTLLGGLAGAGFGFLGAQEGMRESRRFEQDEMEFQARLRNLEERTRTEQAAQEQMQAQAAGMEELNKLQMEGMRWLNPPADGYEAAVRENFDTSVAKLDPHQQRTARGFFQRYMQELPPDRKAILARADPKDFARVLGSIIEADREQKDQAAMQEAQVRAQDMQAQGIPVDITGAKSGQEAMAMLDQAEDAALTAQAFEQQKQEVVAYYGQKIAPKPQEGEDGGDLPPIEPQALEVRKALMRLAASKTPEELQQNALQLELAIDPNGAVARQLQMQQQMDALAQENQLLREMIQGRPGTPEQALAQGPDRPGATPRSMGLDQFKEAPPRKAKEEMAPIAGESAPERAPVEGVTEQAASMGPPDVQAAAQEIDAILQRTKGKEEQNKAVAAYLKEKGLEVTAELVAAIKALAPKGPPAETPGQAAAKARRSERMQHAQ